MYDRRKVGKKVYSLFLLSFIALVCLIIRPDLQAKKQLDMEDANSDKQVQLVTAPLKRYIILQREYLDGEVSEESIVEEILAMEDFWAQYKDWQLIDQNEGRMVFKRKVNDISPMLKTNGYFGITEDGTLSIFNGKPDQSQVIQSFFQIDIGKLESKKHEELKEGIRVLNKNHYVEVIEAFKPYSTVKSKR
ncbi:BofC C-terminal domain-containing protein [Peribacillus tepidiphilus]|uniref:BofC C-terminal domain-containing protein n=1 Tax=Peribacillus tepidiphilus TaxID=2652445 RepID=UPI001CDD2B09|nr:BofC C-terminal domain-containing protein [Peribacillus tepidiphilus]